MSRYETNVDEMAVAMKAPLCTSALTTSQRSKRKERTSGSKDRSADDPGPGRKLCDYDKTRKWIKFSVREEENIVHEEVSHLYFTLFLYKCASRNAAAKLQQKGILVKEQNNIFLLISLSEGR